MPTYNERENLAKIVSAVLAAAPVDLMILDDNSKDGTGALADELAKTSPGLIVVHRPAKNGQGAAYIDGMRRAIEAGYERVFTMDADFSHPPALLKEMLARDQDVVIASRNIKGGRTENRTLVRRLLTRAGAVYAGLVLGTGVADMTSGFKCIRRKVLEAIGVDQIRSNGFAFHIEITYRAVSRGFSVTEVPYTFVDRKEGASKMSGKIMWEAITLCPKLRLER